MGGFIPFFGQRTESFVTALSWGSLIAGLALISPSFAAGGGEGRRRWGEVAAAVALAVRAQPTS
jgi:hypothetical protein